jgi:hypothetical protein
VKGWRFVSRSGLVLGVFVVVGSEFGAPMYLRIAELTPPVKLVSPKLGTLLTQ